jgi:hypothetical protein
MSLTDLSLEMYIFYFQAISLSTHISGWTGWKGIGP